MAREYGKIYSSFWSWSRRHKISVDAERLALYLVGCPHGNASGCFSLPLGYVVSDVFRNGFANGSIDGSNNPFEMVEVLFLELRESGFAYYCTNSEWVLLPNLLRRDPPANKNVGISIAKALSEVPRDFSYAEPLVEGLKSCAERLPEGFVEQLEGRFGLCEINSYPNGSSNGLPNPSAIPEPEPEPIPEPILSSDEDSSKNLDGTPPDKFVFSRDLADRMIQTWNEIAVPAGAQQAQGSQGNREKAKWLYRKMADPGIAGIPKLPLEDQDEIFCRFRDFCQVKIAGSSFLTGKNQKFRANFAWIAKLSNFEKIYEGNYVDRSQEGTGYGAGTHNHPNSRDTFAEAIDRELAGLSSQKSSTNPGQSPFRTARPEIIEVGH